MVTVIGGIKGGTGKSTLATNLAAIDVVNGSDVLLIDADKQGSSSNWGIAREEVPVPRVSVIQKFGGLSLTNEIKSLSKKYQNIYIDAGGHDNEELRASLLVANLVVIPILPSQVDVWTLSSMVEILAKAGLYNADLNPVFVVNGASTHPSIDDASEVRELAKNVEGMVVAESVIHYRRAYQKAVGFGLSVVELTGRDFDPKAAAEITSLYKELTCG